MEMVVVPVPRPNLAQPLSITALFILAHLHLGPRKNENPGCARVLGGGLYDLVVGAGPLAVGIGAIRPLH